MTIDRCAQSPLDASRPINRYDICSQLVIDYKARPPQLVHMSSDTTQSLLHTPHFRHEFVFFARLAFPVRHRRPRVSCCFIYY
jgi:hypothetical protein